VRRPRETTLQSWKIDATEGHAAIVEIRSNERPHSFLKNLRRREAFVKTQRFWQNYMKIVNFSCIFSVSWRVSLLIPLRHEEESQKRNKYIFYLKKDFKNS